MSHAKASLQSAVMSTKITDEAIGAPGWVFHQLTDCMDGGAIVSPDPFGGLSGQINQSLRDMKRRIEGRSSQAAAFAWSNSRRCPPGV